MIGLLLIATFLVLFLTNRESFVEVMGFAGHSKPSRISADKKFDYTGYTEDLAIVTASEIDEMIKLVQGYFTECTYPLETNSIKKFVKSGSEPSVAYKCAFTFMTMKGFVYGFAVQADVVDGVLAGIQTQQMDTGDVIKPYTDDIAKDFTEFEMITKKNMPTLDKLKAVENSL